MNILVRADAGDLVGTGHVVRCTALLRRLALPTSTVTLASAALPAAVQRSVEGLGWRVERIAAHDSCSDAAATRAVIDAAGPIDLLIVDHYSLDRSWERELQGHVGRLMVIDDLADRPHSCDVLLDPTISAHPEARYADLLDGSPVLLLGPSFALLRPEFDAVVPRIRSGSVRHVLVFLGGAATDADVTPLLDALARVAPADLHTTVVLGDAFRGADAVHRAASVVPGVTVIDRTDDMPGLLDWADLAIGATGGAQWERCAAGVPTLTVLTAPNQAHDVAAFAEAGTTRHLGSLAHMTEESWASALSWSLENPVAVSELAAASSRLLAHRHDSWAAAATAILGPAPDPPPEASVSRP